MTSFHMKRRWRKACDVFKRQEMGQTQTTQISSFLFLLAAFLLIKEEAAKPNRISVEWKTSCFRWRSNISSRRCSLKKKRECIVLSLVLRYSACSLLTLSLQQKGESSCLVTVAPLTCWQVGTISWGLVKLFVCLFVLLRSLKRLLLWITVNFRSPREPNHLWHIGATLLSQKPGALLDHVWPLKLSLDIWHICATLRCTAGLLMHTLVEPA